MIKSEQKEIKGHQYSVSLFPAMQGYLIARELIGIFSADDPVARLCQIDKDGELILKLLSNTIRDELAITKTTFDNIYTGNLGELVEALKFVFEANFKDFLLEGGIGNLIQPLQTPRIQDNVNTKQVSSAKS